MVNDEREKRHEQKALNGVGVMHHYMVGVPTVDQLIETVVFDVPSLVPKLDATLDGNLLDGQRGHPHPIAG